MTRKGVWWVETEGGERVQRTDRFRLEYQRGHELYVYEVEPGDNDIAVYADSVRRDGNAQPLPEAERRAVTQGLLALLRFSGDPFTLE